MEKTSCKGIWHQGETDLKGLAWICKQPLSSTQFVLYIFRQMIMLLISLRASRLLRWIEDDVLSKKGIKENLACVGLCAT